MPAALMDGLPPPNPPPPNLPPLPGALTDTDHSEANRCEKARLFFGLSALKTIDLFVGKKRRRLSLNRRQPRRRSSRARVINP